MDDAASAAYTQPVPDRQPFWRCSISSLFYFLDALILLIVFVFQGSVLNFYLIHHFKKSLVHYFWFLGDFLVLILFVWALTVAFQHSKYTQEETSSFSLSPRKVASFFEARFVGVLPLSWITWILYSIMLVAKISILFKTEIPNTLSPTDTFGPQFLKVAIGSTAVIFMLFVEGHHDRELRSQNNNYITTLITGTGFEVMDSVAFLSILFVNESRIVLPFTLENAIITLTTINFLLPTVAIYKLSIADLGKESWPLSLQVLYKILHLLLINVPYLTIRIYLWTAYDHNVSIFIIKNIIGIMAVARSVYPDLLDCYHKSHHTSCWSLIKRQAEEDETITVELHNLPKGEVPQDKMASPKKEVFEEIDLNEDDPKLKAAINGRKLTTIA